MTLHGSRTTNYDGFPCKALADRFIMSRHLSGRRGTGFLGYWVSFKSRTDRATHIRVNGGFFMNARVAILAVGVAFLCLCASSTLAHPPQTAPAKSEQTMAPMKKKAGGQKAGKKPKAKVMRGVPAGVPACLEHLSQMAATEPMTPYEGHP